MSQELWHDYEPPFPLKTAVLLYYVSSLVFKSVACLDGAGGAE